MGEWGDGVGELIGKFWNWEIGKLGNWEMGKWGNRKIDFIALNTYRISG